MVHGKILALEIYFLLILLIQYNIILIMINFRYIILLFANKQWGNSFINNGDFINLPISYTSEIFSFLGLDSGFIRKEQAVTVYSKLEESFINKIKVFTFTGDKGRCFYISLGK